MTRLIALGAALIGRPPVDAMGLDQGIANAPSDERTQSDKLHAVKIADVSAALVSMFGDDVFSVAMR